MRQASRAPTMGLHSRILAVCLLGLAFLVAGTVPESRAQNTLRAAAVVNDEVISVLDLVMRTRLAILASGLTDTPEVRGRLQEQVLRGLIDERLQLQEAQRLDISVTDDQLETAIEGLAQQNQMSRDQFVGFLLQNQILPKALREQVRGNLIWQAVVQRRLQPSVEVGEEEIDEFIGRIESRSGMVQYRVSEILLTVDSVRQEEDIRKAAARLAEELRGGAQFPALARQFSQSATAAVGGDLGWVQKSQLPEEVADALVQMRPGDMYGPIRALGGYYIVWKRDQRQISTGEVTVDLKQLLFALPSDASETQLQAAQAQAANLRPELDGCDKLDALAAEHGSPGSGALGKVRLNDLPPALRQTVAALPVGQPSEPVPVPGGIGLLLVCDRQSDGIDRERIRSSLVNQRVDLLSRRYLRDLRRAANVDIRL